MMSSSDNQSSSSMSMITKPHHNPSSKPDFNSHSHSRTNQERELFVRKSSTFVKSSTTADNPAKFARRCSFGNGIPFQDYEKENEKDPNSNPAVRGRSPSVPKMAKNFMSPTISAISKINPSPGKKILREKNEPIRTSTSLSEGKFNFYSNGPLDFSDENGTKENMVTPPPCARFSHMNMLDEEFSKETKENGFDFGVGVGKIELEPDLVVVSPDNPMNYAIPNEIAPQKYDLPNVGCESCDDNVGGLSLPPYDPKTNFLSPRPRFLRYKPNHRIESYIDQGVRHEQGFSSDSCSETESSEEVQLEGTSSSLDGASINEESSISESNPSNSEQLEESDEHKIEVRPGSGASVNEKNSSILESNPSNSEQLEESGEHKIEVRPWFGRMWKAVCMIIVLLLGFIIMHQGKFAEENINGLLFEMGFKAREVKFSLLPFDNLTAWKEMEVKDRMVTDFMIRVDDFQLRPSIFDEELELRSLDDYEEFDEIEETESEITEDSSTVEDSVIKDEESDLKVISDSTRFSEVEIQIAEHDGTSDTQDEFRRDLKIEDQSLSSLSVAPDVQPQVRDLEFEDQPLSSSSLALEVQPQVTSGNDPTIDIQREFQVNSKAEDQSLSSLGEPPEVQSEITSANDPVTQLSESSTLETIDETNALILEANEGSLKPRIAAASAVVSLLTATAFMLLKNWKRITEKENSNISATTKIEPKVQEDQTSSRGSPVEVDMMGESEPYPSEMSSFRKTSPYNFGLEKHQKSSNRSHKRESFALSSSEYTRNSSYGSFTTYSILQFKQGEDEVVTPVRRSSRIRSKVISP